MTSTPPRAMTIAGSDAGGGSGIQADLKTFAAFGIYGTSVVTAVTAQNTREVAAIAEVPEEIVIAQIDTIVEDIGTDAIKTGMLSARSIVEVVVDRLGAWGAPKLVVDPLIIAASGAPLLQPDALATLKRELLPMALVVTPTVQQIELLTHRTIRSPEDGHAAARMLSALGPRYVVLKGGQTVPSDLVFDGESFTALDGAPVDAANLYGLDSTFSAAITALLARGEEPMAAIATAKRYVEQAARAAYAVGDGRKPLNHLFALEPLASGPAPS